MLSDFSYEPGINVYHDLIFTLFLIVISLISYWSMFYGLRYILTPDRNRIMNKEKYVFKLILKLIVLLYPIAMFIGFPLFVNLISGIFIFFGAVVTIFDSSYDFNYLLWGLFIIIYVPYLYYFFKPINRKMERSLEESIKFFSDWDMLAVLNPFQISDPNLYETRRNSTIWTIHIYKLALHFSVVPVIIVALLKFILEII